LREVTLKLKIRPDEERGWGAVEIHASSKLAPVHPYPTQIIIGKQRGKGMATEHNPKQLKMFQEQPKEGKVLELTGKEKTE
jgi:hypothetical protein